MDPRAFLRTSTLSHGPDAGIAHAPSAAVAGARHFTELIVWQLADELREHISELTKKRPFATDLKLRSQLDDASDSVCRNC